MDGGEVVPVIEDVGVVVVEAVAGVEIEDEVEVEVVAEGGVVVGIEDFVEGLVLERDEAAIEVGAVAGVAD